MLQAIELMTGPTYEVLVFGKNNSKTISLINQINQINQPNKVMIFSDTEDKNDLSNIIRFTKIYPITVDDNPMVYVCKNYSCNLPTNDLEIIKTQLHSE